MKSRLTQYKYRQAQPHPRHERSEGRKFVAKTSDPEHLLVWSILELKMQCAGSEAFGELARK
jgi:hypothetical protein